MTPPEHLLMGTLVANSAYAVRVMKGKNMPSYGALLIAGALCAVLPDIDSFFRHYGSANPWVGHRGMTHSLLWCLLQGSVIAYILYRTGIKGRAGSLVPAGVGDEKKSAFLFLFVTALAASVSHVVADLPQPASVWHGIPVFFPLTVNGEYLRSGGWGRIGWYDFKIMIHLFLTALVTGGLCAALGAAGRSMSRPVKGFIGGLVLVMGLGSFIWTGYYISTCSYTSAEHWEQYQEEVLLSYPDGVRRIIIGGRRVLYDMFVYMRRHF
ncbi:MAG TPA: metal-dependent hydrolase [Spirochaetota bacterium]|nr:metal-dependent hydrolase [Spirochaetota bacterium]